VFAAIELQDDIIGITNNADVYTFRIQELSQ
jgi:hypothetical protein